MSSLGVQLGEKPILNLSEFHGAEHSSSSLAAWLIFIVLEGLVICSTTAYHLSSRFVYLLQSIGGRDADRCGADQC